MKKRSGWPLDMKNCQTFAIGVGWFATTTKTATYGYQAKDHFL